MTVTIGDTFDDGLVSGTGYGFGSKAGSAGFGASGIRIQSLGSKRGKLVPSLVRSRSGSCFHQGRIRKGFHHNLCLVCLVFFQPWLEEIIASKGCKRNCFEFSLV